MHLKSLITHLRKQNLFLCYDLLFQRYQILKSMNKIDDSFVLSQHFFRYFNHQKLINGGSDFYKSYHFLNGCHEDFQMYICKFVLTDSGFFLVSAQNCKKHGSQTNDLTFSSTFSALTVTFIFLFEKSQNSFSCGKTLFHSDL